MPGLSGEVVDIVAIVVVSMALWRWHIEHRDQNNLVDPAYWKANIALTGKHSTTSLSLGIDNNYRRLGHGGPETVFDDADNVMRTVKRLHLMIVINLPSPLVLSLIRLMVIPAMSIFLTNIIGSQILKLETAASQF